MWKVFCTKDGLYRKIDTINLRFEKERHILPFFYIFVFLLFAIAYRRVFIIAEYFL